MTDTAHDDHDDGVKDPVLTGPCPCYKSAPRPAAVPIAFGRCGLSELWHKTPFVKIYENISTDFYRFLRGGGTTFLFLDLQNSAGCRIYRLKI